MEASLKGLMFHLDPRMGAIVDESELGVDGEGGTLVGKDVYQSAG